MKKLFLIQIFTLHAMLVFSQSVQLFAEANKENHIALKWFTSKIDTSAQFNLYRKINNEDWKKINNEPISMAAVAALADCKSEVAKIKLQMSTPGNFSYRDVQYQSIFDNRIATCIAHYFEDKDVQTEPGNRYQYKLSSVENAKEKELASTTEILSNTSLTVELNSPEVKVINNKVQLKWNTLKNYLCYDVYKRKSGEVQSSILTLYPIKIADTNASSFFSDTNLLPATYYYSVLGFTAFGKKSIISAESRAEVKPAGKQSGAIISGIYNNANRIEIDWDNKSADKIKGYNIYRNTASDPVKKILNGTLLTASTSSYIDNNVQLKNTYTYSIETVKADESKNVSSEKSFLLVDGIAPAVPKNIKANSLPGAIELKWDAVTDKDLLGYLVYRASEDITDAYVLLNRKPFLSTTYTDSLRKNLQSGFYYKVTAIDSNGNIGVYSPAYNAAVKDIIKPFAPYLISASAKKNGMALFWQKNSEPDLAGYDLYRKEFNANPVKLNKILLPAKTDSFIDSTVSANINYTYYINAKDQSDNVSEKSNEISGRHPGIVSKKINISATYDSETKTIKLIWNEPELDNIIGYSVYRKSSDKDSFLPISKILVNNGFIDKQTTYPNTYVYFVEMKLSDGASIKSNTVQATAE